MATTPDLVIEITPDASRLQLSLAEVMRQVVEVAAAFERAVASCGLQMAVTPEEMAELERTLRRLGRRRGIEQRRIRQAMGHRARRAARRGRRAAARAARERSR